MHPPDMPSDKRISIILPAKNEAASLKKLLPALREGYPQAEILVVDDGSTDGTIDICHQHKVTVISRPYSIGNGGAIKAGARMASGEKLVFMDADGQHDPADVSRLISTLDQGFDMAVGARGEGSQASLGRGLANGLYNRLASWMVGQQVKDLTSGFRAVRADKFREFVYLLPNGFSYPTTITMAFFRSGYTVSYVPIHAAKRLGKSHIKPFKDSVRFLLIIFKIGTLYSPLKLFLPISAAFFLTGVLYYLYTFTTEHRFTNMSALLLITSVLVLLIGLVSEQITTLNYKDNKTGS